MANKRFGLLLSLLVGWVLGPMIAPAVVCGDDGYTALDSGRDAYLRHESRRRFELDQQLGLVQQLGWLATLPPYADPYSPWAADPFYSPAYHTPYAAGPYSAAWRGELRSRWGFLGLRPYLLGGYPYVATVPQPIGQRQIQTGPNRWESHPVFPGQPFPARPLPSPPAGPNPPAASPQVKPGPREF